MGSYYFNHVYTGLAYVRRLFLPVLLTVLSACSSSGDDSTDNSSNAAPVVDAGMGSVLGDNKVFELSGSASDSDGQVASLTWSQIAGPAVVIESAGAAVASVNPGDLAADATMRFRLTAVDNDGATSTDEVEFSIVNDSSALRATLGPLSQALVTITALNTASEPVIEETTSETGYIVIPHDALDSHSGFWLIGEKLPIAWLRSASGARSTTSANSAGNRNVWATASTAAAT